MSDMGLLVLMFMASFTLGGILGAILYAKGLSAEIRRQRIMMLKKQNREIKDKALKYELISPFYNELLKKERRDA